MARKGPKAIPVLQGLLVLPALKDCRGSKVTLARQGLKALREIPVQLALLGLLALPGLPALLAHRDRPGLEYCHRAAL